MRFAHKDDSDSKTSEKLNQQSMRSARPSSPALLGLNSDRFVSANLSNSYMSSSSNGRIENDPCVFGYQNGNLDAARFGGREKQQLDLVELWSTKIPNLDSVTDTKNNLEFDLEEHLKIDHL